MAIAMLFLFSRSWKWEVCSWIHGIWTRDVADFSFC